MSEALEPEIAILGAALELPAAERAAYLDRACAGDAVLRRQVEALLRAHEEAEGFLGNSLAGTDLRGALGIALTEKPGDVIGRYKLLQKIGEGGCGVVYLAEQIEPVRRQVALKVVKLGMDTQQVIARFEAERQALALMDHPNIAKVLDGGATNSGRPYFVMELVRGTKITQFCDEHRLSTPERLKLFIQVCEAIQHAHQKEIIHRDIKPSNILVTINNGVPVPKVIDFGIAKATQGRLTERTLFTAFEQFIGTPAYMSPEQAIMTSLDIDTRSDIYSLGVLLYELLTGKTPFDHQELLAAGFDEMRRTIREKKPSKPSTRLSLLQDAERTTTASQRQTEPPGLVHLIQGDLDWIAMKCLEKDRTRRYETANGLAADIHRHLNNEPVTACPPSSLYRLRKAIRRHKTAFATAGAIAVALVAGVIASTTQAIRATRAEHEQTRLRKQAESAGDIARANAERAANQEMLARRHFYAAQINLANQAAEAGELARAIDLLETLRPQPGESDLRGFEWYYIWRFCNGPLLRTIQAHASPVLNLAFSPDGATLASSSEEGAIGLWETRTGQQKKLLRPVPTAAVRGVAFTPDGRTLVSAGWEGVRLWDTDTGQQRLALGETNEFWSVAVSADGKKIAAGNKSGEVLLWDLATGRELGRMQQHSDAVTSVAFSPDNAKLVSGSGWGKDGGALNLWTVTNDTLQLRAHITNPAPAVAFSPDGRTLANTMLGFLQFRDPGTGELRATVKEHAGDPGALVFLSNTNLVSCGEDRTLWLWQPSQTNDLESHPIGGHLESAFSLALSRDGKVLTSGANDGSVRLWDMAKARKPTGAQARLRYNFGESTVRGGLHSLHVLPDSRTVLLVTGKGTSKRELDTGRIQDTWPEAAGRGALSPDGKLLATATRDGQVSLWDVATGRLLASVTAHTNGEAGIYVALAFSPDSRALATGGPNNETTIKLWDIAAPLKFIRGLDTPPGWGLSALGYSPDGKTLAAGTRHEQAFLVDVETGEIKRTLHLGAGYINATVFSPDGKLLATCREGGAISLWDVENGSLHASLKGHASAVFTVAFSPDGGTLVSGGEDHTVRLWDVVTGQERLMFKMEESNVNSVAFSLDGNSLLAGYSNGRVHLWRGARLPEADFKPLPVDKIAELSVGESNPGELNQLAWSLATSPDAAKRDGRRAVEYAKKAVAASGRHSEQILDTLAAAYAEAGRFPEAIRAQQEAIAVLKDTKYLEEFNSRLRLYKKNMPYREATKVKTTEADHNSDSR